MGCDNCKKKNKNQNNMQHVAPRQHNNVDIDRWGTAIIIVWFLLGVYGLYSLIKDIVGLL